MSDSDGVFDQIMDILAKHLEGSSAADLLPGAVSFDEITDMIADAGLDVSQLSDADIASLVSFVDSTTIEFPDGTKVEHTETDQFGFGATGLLGAGSVGALWYERTKQKQQLQ